jgi:isoleucyl-tRNA synthetase
VQNARKSAGLQVEDRIELTLDGDTALRNAAQAHLKYLASETLTVNFGGLAPTAPAEMTHVEQATIDGLTLSIALRRVEQPTS